MALTANTGLMHRAYPGHWGVWLNLGGQWTSDPGAVSQRNGSADLVEKAPTASSDTAIPSPTL